MKIKYLVPILLTCLFSFMATACSNPTQQTATVDSPESGYDSTVILDATKNDKPENTVSTQNSHSPWVKKKSMPVKLLTQRAVVINDRIYVLGTIDRYSDCNELYEYDPVTDSWTRKTSSIAGKGTVISGGGAAVLNGRLYTFGGGILKSAEIFEKTFYVQEYDPATDKWVLKGTLPDKNYAFGAAALNDRIYIVGGELSVVEEYDPAKNQWVSKTPPPLYYQDAGIIASNGRIYAISGAGTSSVSEYDPETDRWEIKSMIITNRIHLFPVTVGNTIYAINGVLMPLMKQCNNVEAYDPLRDQWTEKGPAPATTYSSGIAAVNGRIYLIGGELDGEHAGPVFDVYEYDPSMEK